MCLRADGGPLWVHNEPGAGHIVGQSHARPCAGQHDGSQSGAQSTTSKEKQPSSMKAVRRFDNTPSDQRCKKRETKKRTAAHYLHMNSCSGEGSKLCSCQIKRGHVYHSPINSALRWKLDPLCALLMLFFLRKRIKIGGRVGGNGWRKGSRGWGKQGVELFMWKGIIRVGCIWNCSALFSKREMRLRGLSLSAFLKKTSLGDNRDGELAVVDGDVDPERKGDVQEGVGDASARVSWSMPTPRLEILLPSG